MLTPREYYFLENLLLRCIIVVEDAMVIEAIDPPLGTFTIAIDEYAYHEFRKLSQLERALRNL